MCKVMMMAGLSSKHKAKAESLAKEMMKIISKTEKDGFGYAAITANGTVYGEKYLNADDFMSKQPPGTVDPVLVKIKKSLGEGIKDIDVMHNKYKAFGTKTAPPVAMIIHSRWSTVGGDNIDNAHPFFELDDANAPATALIHNGTIKNHLELTKKYSTCDSEVILHEYNKNLIQLNPYGIHDLARTLRGEYAVGVLSSSDDGPIMDIFKSNKPLNVGYVKELDCLVFATRSEDLIEAVKAAGMTLKITTEVIDGRFMRFNAVTGERVGDVIKFDLSNTYYYQQYTPPARTVTPASTTETKKEEVVVVQVQKYVADLTLSDKEKEYLKQLEVDNKSNKVALRLVKMVVGAG